ncbi:unnamed protein product [Pleuronectes platessa]|uniref:Uncharacterized protein n=1 Tax=Pleuronectes platessa TaxID=8262 RepID=A0A9N7V476_PLEPL|nr:unnamed protein product [Pleuronectes platessa]
MEEEGFLRYTAASHQGGFGTLSPAPKDPCILSSGFLIVDERCHGRLSSGSIRPVVGLSSKFDWFFDSSAVGVTSHTKLHHYTPSPSVWPRPLGPPQLPKQQRRRWRRCVDLNSPRERLLLKLQRHRRRQRQTS